MQIRKLILTFSWRLYNYDYDLWMMWGDNLVNLIWEWIQKIIKLNILKPQWNNRKMETHKTSSWPSVKSEDNKLFVTKLRNDRRIWIVNPCWSLQILSFCHNLHNLIMRLPNVRKKEAEGNQWAWTDPVASKPCKLKAIHHTWFICKSIMFFKFV